MVNFLINQLLIYSHINYAYSDINLLYSLTVP